MTVAQGLTYCRTNLLSSDDGCAAWRNCARQLLGNGVFDSALPHNVA